MVTRETDYVRNFTTLYYVPEGNSSRIQLYLANNIIS